METQMIYFLITTGGGTEHNGASMNLVEAAKEAKEKNENSYFKWQKWWHS